MLETTGKAIWRETGFLIKQERDRESDDTSQLSDLFTFEELNPQTHFSTRFSRTERLQLAWFFLRSALFANK